MELLLTRASLPLGANDISKGVDVVAFLANRSLAQQLPHCKAFLP